MVDKIRGQLTDFYQAVYEIPKISAPTGGKRLLNLNIFELKQYLVTKSKKNMEGILKVINFTTSFCLQKHLNLITPILIYISSIIYPYISFIWRY